MTNENGKVMVELAKFIFNAMKVRENAIQNDGKYNFKPRAACSR